MSKKIIIFINILVFFSLTNISIAKDFLRIISPLHLDCEIDRKKNIGYLIKVKYDSAVVREYDNPLLTQAGRTEQKIFNITNEDKNTIYLEHQIYTYARNTTITVDRVKGKIYVMGTIEHNCEKVTRTQFNRLLSMEEKRSKGEVKPNKF